MALDRWLFAAVTFTRYALLACATHLVRRADGSPWHRARATERDRTAEATFTDRAYLALATAVHPRRALPRFAEQPASAMVRARSAAATLMLRE